MALGNIGHHLEDTEGGGCPGTKGAEVRSETIPVPETEPISQVVLTAWLSIPFIISATVSLFFSFFFFFRFYLFIHDRHTEREREAETQAEGEAGSMQGARRGTRSWVSRIRPWAEGGAKLLSHPGCPVYFFLNCYTNNYDVPGPWLGIKDRGKHDLCFVLKILVYVGTSLTHQNVIRLSRASIKLIWYGKMWLISECGQIRISGNRNQSHPCNIITFKRKCNLRLHWCILWGDSCMQITWRILSWVDPRWGLRFCIYNKLPNNT